MGFLILGQNMLGSRGNAQYRGTYRESIPHADELAEDSEYNALFDWYVNEEASGQVRDLSRVKRLLTLLHSDLGRSEFEVVEAIEEGEPRKSQGVFVGYDLSQRFSYSLLSWGLEFEHMDQESLLSPAVHDLVALVESHFKPNLNVSGLFLSKETASSCLRSMMALQVLSPGLWENDNAVDFKVVGIFEVL